MLVTTTQIVPGHSHEVLGMVRGDVVASRNFIFDLLAAVRMVFGFEIKSYTKLIDRARSIAEERMVAEAEALGADAVIATGFTSGCLTPLTIMAVYHGTAVKFVD